MWIMNKRAFSFSLLVLLTVLMVSACDEAAYSGAAPNVSGVQARATLEYVHALQTSTAQAHNAAEWQATVQAAATQDAQQAAYVAAQATDESIRAAAQATQTQQAWSATATSDSAVATSTAAANATAVSWAGTATQAAWDRQGTAEAASLQALQTAQAAQADMARMAAERQRTINKVQAAAPWVILSFAVPLVAYMAWLWGRTEALRRRAIPRDARGDAPILLLDSRGRRSVVDPDLMFGAVVTIDKAGQASAPTLNDTERQAQVKARDQAVDLVNRGLPGQPPRRRALPAILPSTDQNTIPTVRVVEPDQVSDWLDDVMPEVQRQALEKGGKDDG
jgi:hypothetical protein